MKDGNPHYADNRNNSDLGIAVPRNETPVMSFPYQMDASGIGTFEVEIDGDGQH